MRKSDMKKPRITINIPAADIRVEAEGKVLLNYTLRDYQLDCDPEGLAMLVAKIAVDVQKKLK